MFWPCYICGEGVSDAPTLMQPSSAAVSLNHTWGNRFIFSLARLCAIWYDKGKIPKRIRNQVQNQRRKKQYFDSLGSEIKDTMEVIVETYQIKQQGQHGHPSIHTVVLPLLLKDINQIVLVITLFLCIPLGQVPQHLPVFSSNAPDVMPDVNNIGILNQKIKPSSAPVQIGHLILLWNPTHILCQGIYKYCITNPWQPQNYWNTGKWVTFFWFIKVDLVNVSWILGLHGILDQEWILGRVGGCLCSSVAMQTDKGRDGRWRKQNWNIR